MKKLLYESDFFYMHEMIKTLSSRPSNIKSTPYGFEALTFLFDSIYIRLCTKLFGHIVGIPMGTRNRFILVLR